MSHTYNKDFFDYIDAGAQSSAEVLTNLLANWIAPRSVLDLGCGRGVWLSAWSRAGASDVLGVDGDYVNRADLAIDADNFHAADLTRPLSLGRRFDLAQSLEVGEHLPETASDQLVDSLTEASDIVLFSAAVVGQGGEFHVNEQPLSFWQAKFLKRGYRPFDCLRGQLAADRRVEPWYRYNSVLYANAAGEARLPEQVLRHRVADAEKLSDAGSLAWRLRRGIVRHLPRAAVTCIAQSRASILANRARRMSRA